MMNKSEEFRKRTSVIFLTFLFSFFYAISVFYFTRWGVIRQITGSSGQIVMLLLWATIQIMTLISYFRYVVSKTVIKYTLFLYLFVVLLTIVFGLLYVLGVYPAFNKIIFNTFSNIIALIATGLFSLITALAYKQFKQLIPPYEEEEEIEVIEKRKIQPRSKPFKIYTMITAIILCFISVVFILIDEYKISGSFFWLACLTFGFRAKWNSIRFQKTPTQLMWALVLFSSIMGFYGALYDWFTGFMFYLCNFIILFITNSYKNESVTRWVIMFFSMLFAFIGLLFHFMFSLRYY